MRSELNCKENKKFEFLFSKNRKILTKASIFGRKREVEREREREKKIFIYWTLK